MSTVEYVTILKFLLNTYFKMAKMAGVSDEDRDTYYKETRKEFKEKDPSNLPDV